ncbi:MAG: polyphosphate kinase 2 [Omnitrophica WOR_2 bacterium]|jgi:polyphosphate kinase 2
MIEEFNTARYRRDYIQLQIELLKLQKWIYDQRLRVVIIFEGRDTAGKGGAIYRFIRYLNPRFIRVVALPKPSEIEKGQWYFQRYIKELPNPGEMVFFDRSWYNRAVVEPVMGFCTKDQYELFLNQAPKFEEMLMEDGMIIIKFWFSIDIQEQKVRIEDRMKNPLKRWKLSTVDLKAQQMWDEYTWYKNQMFLRTHNDQSPWVIIKGNNKSIARIEAMRYVLWKIDYPEKRKAKVSFEPNSEIITLFDPAQMLM